jgi:hypothetical protein
MFRAAHRSSSGALTVFAASCLHTHVVTGRSQVWVGTGFPVRLDYGRSPHGYVNQRLQIQLELLMMRGVPLQTCWAFNGRWNNKFYYTVASCWLFLLSLKWIILYWNNTFILAFLSAVPPVCTQTKLSVSRPCYLVSSFKFALFPPHH